VSTLSSLSGNEQPSDGGTVLIGTTAIIEGTLSGFGSLTLVESVMYFGASGRYFEKF